MSRTLEPLRLWPATAPGSEDWSIAETEWSLPNPISPAAQELSFAWNVVEPTLTPVLPDPDVASGAAIIVCPGGGYFSLAMSYEGYQVAEWLAERGIAAFVLKYRVRQVAIERDEDYFTTLMQVGDPEGLAAVLSEMEVFGDIPLADGRMALRLVRDRAEEFGIDAARLGMVGFSAGARLCLDLATLDDAAERPAFIGALYGPRVARPVPQGAPPLFAAVAADDFFYNDVRETEEAWRAVGSTAEAHYYPTGGHGWGMVEYGRTSDGWIEAFHRWVEYVDRQDIAAANA